jgi:hypothetical protein
MPSRGGPAVHPDWRSAGRPTTQLQLRAAQHVEITENFRLDDSHFPAQSAVAAPLSGVGQPGVRSISARR